MASRQGRGASHSRRCCHPPSTPDSGGTTHRPQTPPPRPQQAHAHRRGDSRRGLDQELPNRRPDAHQPYPKDNEPRTKGLPADLVGRLPNRSPPAASVRRTCCSPPATAPPSPPPPAAP